MDQMTDNYELVYQGLREKMAEIDLSERAIRLGGYQHRDCLWITCFGTDYAVDPLGIRTEEGKEPNVAVRIVLSHYLLQAGTGNVTGEWHSYRDFKDAAFFISNFQVNVENRIAQHFSGKTRELAEAGSRLGGTSYDVFQAGDVCTYFQALPRLPLLLVFYDRDEDFPASSKVLFDKSAPTWLDMECLAVLGWILADGLVRLAG